MTNPDKSAIGAWSAGDRFTRREGGCPIKYRQWYNGLISAAKSREVPARYTEAHHILPRSLGGSDLPENLVRLTYREHFLAHWLLTKMHKGDALQKMRLAFYAMSLRSNGGRIISSLQFEAVKRALADLKLATARKNEAPSGLVNARQRFKEHKAIGAAKKHRELDRMAAEFLSQNSAA